MTFIIYIEIHLDARMIMVVVFISLLIINLVSLHVVIVIIHFHYFGIGCSNCHGLLFALAEGLFLITLNFIFRARDLVNVTFIAFFSVFAV